MAAEPPVTNSGRLYGRLTVVLVLIVSLTVMTVGAAVLVAFDRAVEPELANRTRLIAVMIRGEVQRAVEIGIPFDSLVGLDDYLADTLERFEEVDRISVTSVMGAVVATAERSRPPSLLERAGFDAVIGVTGTNFTLPIIDGNRIVGEIRASVSPLFVQTRLREVFLDVVVVGMVAALIAVELVIAIVVASVNKPMRRVLLLLREQGEGRFLHRIRPGGIGGIGRVAVRLNDHAEDLAERVAHAARNPPEGLMKALNAGIASGRPSRLRLSDINDIRLPLFLLSLGSEIAAAFLPVYARAAARPAWLAPELAAAAPLLVYIGAIALLTPFAARLVERIGARRLFILSAAGIAAALAGMGVAGTLVEIALWRGVIGLAYAIATISVQEYGIRAAGAASGARAVAGFLAVIYSGVFCGSAIGGVIGDRFGFAAAFGVAAVVVVLSGALGHATLAGRAGLAQPDASAASPAVERRRMRGSYIALLFGISIPMNATTAIFIWYLTPLMLAASGSGAAETARVVMLYYLAVVLFGSPVARLADRGSGAVVLILAGAGLSAAALASLYALDGFWPVAVAVFAAGMGHTLIRAPQYAVALRIAAEGGPSLTGLRLFERLGALAGLACVALLLDELGPKAVLAGLAVLVISGAALFAVVMATARVDGMTPKTIT